MSANGHSKNITARADTILLDSSVIIAALLSPTGGSFYVITHMSPPFRLVVSEYILSEVREVLARKFAQQQGLQKELLALLVIGDVEILSIEVIAKVRPLYEVLNQKDAPILASALAHCGFILSLDNHFLSQDVVEYAADHKLIICTPGVFIQKNIRKS